MSTTTATDDSTPESTPAEKVTRPSIDEVYGSLNWFDEQLIVTNLKVDPHELMEEFVASNGGLSSIIKIARTWDFVLAVRDGMTPPLAAAKVQKLTAKELNEIGGAYLSSHEDEDTEAQDSDEPGEEPVPVTEAGKGEPGDAETTLT